MLSTGGATVSEQQQLLITPNTVKANKIQTVVYSSHFETDVTAESNFSLYNMMPS